MLGYPLGMQTPSPGSRLEPARASIRICAIPGGTMISLSGDHDLSSKRELVESLARVPCDQRVLINLENCTFVDSTIINAVLTACRGESSRDPNASVVLPPDTSYVYRALSVIGLRDLVPTHRSIEAALEDPPDAASQPAADDASSQPSK